MTAHPNNMCHWESIGCTFGHETHDARLVPVRLGGQTAYRDLPGIPRRFTREFGMVVFDWEKYWDLSGYCPARDAVSQTILSHGVWEPSETALVLSAATASAGLPMLDFGSQIGWFSILAAQCGMYPVQAYDADAENLRLLQLSAAANTLTIESFHARITSNSVLEGVPNGRIGLVKIDVEGAERDVLWVLWPLVQAGLIDHMLIEISPVFDDYYPKLVTDIIACGYEAYVLPEKSRNPPSLEHPYGALQAGALHPMDQYAREAEIASWHQKNVWFCRPDARWA